MTVTGRDGRAGFALIELMVAMLVGLFLAAGLIYGYAGAMRSYNFNTALSRIQENGRFAMYLLLNNLREAGYMGCAAGTGRIRRDADAANRGALSGFDNLGSAWPAPLAHALKNETPVPGSDVIIVRRAGDTAVRSDEMVPGRTYVTTNCIRAVVHRGDNPGHTMTASHSLPWLATVYFLAKGTHAGVPALWRQRSDHPAAEELVPGVEDMQIRYGEDLDGDQTADVYRSAADVSDMNHVVSVHIALLLVSLRPVSRRPTPYAFTVFSDNTPDDRHLRREATVTVDLRNHGP